MGNLHFGRQSNAPTLPKRPHFNQVMPGSTQSLSASLWLCTKSAQKNIAGNPGSNRTPDSIPIAPWLNSMNCIRNAQGYGLCAAELLRSFPPEHA